MKVIHGLESLDPPLRQVILTVGNFDGFHRAHRRLLEQAIAFAQAGGNPVVVLTFDPHPLSIVAPQHTPPRLTTTDQKLQLLREAGADVVVVARSEPKLLGTEADRFVEDILIRLFHPTHIVEGPSFGFGRGRKGTPELLASVAGRFECEVHIVDPVRLTLAGEKDIMVSSSLVRRLIAAGSVLDASLCLARPYCVTGKVAEGARRGRTIGFPTANLADIEQLVPGDGVYAGRALVGGQAYLAAISIGRTPTFGGGDRQVEAHLLDFDADIYGQSIQIDFERRLRDQCTFASASELTDQLHRDVEAVRTGSASVAMHASPDKAPTP